MFLQKWGGGDKGQRGTMGRIFVIKNGGQAIKKNGGLSGAAARTGKVR